MKHKKLIQILGLVCIRLLVISLIVTFVMIFINHPGTKNKNKKQKLDDLLRHKFIAHRGYFGKDAAENSLEAFEAATINDIGIELDVHLTKDDKVVVIHDETLGKNAITVPDNPTQSQIDIINKKFLTTPVYELNKQDIDAVTSKFLLYGFNTKVPELSEVIEKVKAKQYTDQKTLILVEIKANNTNSKTYINNLCQKVSDIIKQNNYKSIEFAIQSFHPLVVKWFKQNAPDVIRGFLSKDFVKDNKNGDPKGFIGFMLANNYFNFIIRPDFISYGVLKNKSYCLGQSTMFNYHSVNLAWTIRNIEDYKLAKKQGFTNFIFDGVDIEDLRKK